MTTIEETKPKNKMFIEITPSSWEGAKRISRKLYPFYYFRGHADKTWQLQTSLERAADLYECSSYKLWNRERIILHDFKARAHQYLPNPPSDDDLVEWLSLLQDYGGPTRLLDFYERISREKYSFRIGYEERIALRTGLTLQPHSFLIVWARCCRLATFRMKSLRPATRNPIRSSLSWWFSRDRLGALLSFSGISYEKLATGPLPARTALPAQACRLHGFSQGIPE